MYIASFIDAGKPKKNNQLYISHWYTVSHKVVSSTLHHAWFGSHTVIVWNLSHHMSIGVYKVGSSTP